MKGSDSENKKFRRILSPVESSSDSEPESLTSKSCYSPTVIDSESSDSEEEAKVVVKEEEEQIK